MKKYIALNIKIVSLAFIISSAIESSLAFPITITTFGSNAQNGGFWTYNATTSTISGVEQIGDLIYNSNTFSLDLTGITGITINAHATEAPPFQFTFLLQDDQGNERGWQLSWLSFNGTGPVEVTKTGPYDHVLGATFNWAQVEGWNLVGGSSGQSINVTLYSAVAIPEPSTLGLLGMSAIAAYYLRRRRLKALH